MGQKENLNPVFLEIQEVGRRQRETTGNILDRNIEFPFKTAADFVCWSLEEGLAEGELGEQIIKMRPGFKEASGIYSNVMKPYIDTYSRALVDAAENNYEGVRKIIKSVADLNRSRAISPTTPDEKLRLGFFRKAWAFDRLHDMIPNPNPEPYTIPVDALRTKNLLKKSATQGGDVQT